MGARLKAAGRRAFLAGCALALVGATAGSALADLKPQRPPPHRGALRPDPVPGASSSKTVAKTPLSTTPSAVRVSVVPRSTPRTYVVSPPRKAAASRPSARPTAPKPRERTTAAAHRFWPDVRHRAASLTSVRALPGSRRSWLVLAAGVGLVLLVIGESTFLRISGAWFGLPAPARSRATRPPEPTIAVRQVRARR